MTRTAGRRGQPGWLGADRGARRRRPGRCGAVLVVPVLVVLLGAAPGWVFWTAPAPGSGTATTATLLPPAEVTATGTAWASSVDVAWTAATTSDGSPAPGYVVTRVREGDGTLAPACGTSIASPVATLTCADTGVPDGAHHYVVTALLLSWTATSAASNTFSTDTTAPAVAVASVSPAAETSGYHRTSPVVLTLAATDTGGSGVASITYQVDAAPPVTVPAVTASVPVSGDGDHTVTFAATDAAGTTSTTGSHFLRLDTTAPGVTVDQAPSQPDPTPALPVHFTATFSEPVTGFTDADVTVSGTAGATYAVVTGSGATYDVAVGGTTGDGTVVVSIGADRALDAAGNGNTASTSSDDSVVRDATPPAAPSPPALAGASDTGASSSDTITSDATPSYTGSAEAGSTVTLYADGTLVGSGPATGGTYAVTTATLADGTRTITARATDAAGNTSGPSDSRWVTIDTVGPAVSTPLLATASDSGASSSDGVTHDTTPTYTGTAEAGATVTLVAGTTDLATGTATGGSWTITTGVLSEASRTVTARATDIAGNTTVSTGVALTVDTTAPTLELSSLVAGLGRTLTASGTTDDVATVSTMVCQGTGLLGTTQPSFPCGSPAAQLTATPHAGTWGATSGNLGLITTYFARATQTDLAGNTATSTVRSATTIL